ncbi:MAG: cupin domain-containing protein [Pirellulaceae bacterium]
MKVQHFETPQAQSVEMPGVEGCQVRQLITQQDGAPGFAMRQFEVAPGGYTPHHSHPYEHEVFVIEGNGEVLEGDQPKPIRAGDVVYVAPDEVHQFRNSGTTPLKFLCLVPNAANNAQFNIKPECAQ